MSTSILLLFFSCVLMCRASFFFFKQKTAYEMRISDWSSDVCSSDLQLAVGPQVGVADVTRNHIAGNDIACGIGIADLVQRLPRTKIVPCHEIGRASCRERVCQYV